MSVSERKEVTSVDIINPIKIDEKKWYLDLRIVIPSILSLFALSVSLISLGVFSSFDLDFYSSGAYVIHTNVSDNFVQGMAFILPIEFLNINREQGIVTSMSLEISDGLEKVEYVPLYEVNVGKLDTKTDSRGESYWRKSIIGPFQNFGLSEKERVSKSIMFGPILPGRVVVLAEGEYSMKLLVNASNGKTYYKEIFPTFILDNKTIEKINDNYLVFIRSDNMYAYFKEYN
ncbi:hypothetical protein HYV86_05860 [Candidatus Woesearchaeota archaeon]|nr:hypothetical protein [Candidatus Woesearchaeota archaeon]